MSRYTRISVFITGPTRSGTTFVLALVHHMGFYTGYVDSEVAYVQSKAVAAGLEYLIDRRARGAYPYVIKHPASWVGGHSVFKTIDDRELEIQHMIVTQREFEPLVKSNVKFVSSMRSRAREDRSVQIEAEVRKVLPIVMKELFDTIAERNIDHTVIEFPRMVQDREYLFDKIKLRPKVTREKFDTAFYIMADTNKVHH